MENNLNEGMINKALERNLNAHVCDVERLCYDNRFDAVFSNATLHWMMDYQSVINGVHKALKTRISSVLSVQRHWV